jgi:hypothetical protein
VDRRQGIDGKGVFASGENLLVSIVQEPSPGGPGVDLKIPAIEPRLDRDFPYAGGADKRVSRYFHDRFPPHGAREPVGAGTK